MKLKHLAAAGLGILLFGCGGGDGSGIDCRIELEGALVGSMKCVSEFKDGQLMLRPYYDDSKPVAVLIAQFGAEEPQVGITYDETTIESLIVAADPEDEEDRAFVAVLGKPIGVMFGDAEMTLSNVTGGVLHGTFFGTLECVSEDSSVCQKGEEIEASGTF